MISLRLQAATHLLMLFCSLLLLPTPPAAQGNGQERPETHPVLDSQPMTTEELLKILTEDPRSSFALSRLGHIYFVQEKDPEMAEVYYDQALRNEPSIEMKKKYLFARGRHYQKLAMYRRAVQDFNEALAYDPDFSAALQAKQQSLEQMKRQLTETATPVVNKTTTADTYQTDLLKTQLTEQARSYLIDGARYFYNGNIPASLRMFLRAVSADPKQPQAYYMLGKIAETKNAPVSQVMIYYRQAYELNPTSADYRAALSYGLYRQHMFEKAVVILNSLINEYPGRASNYYLRALCYQKTNHQRKALADFSTALKSSEDLSFIENFDDRFVLKPDPRKKLLPWRPGAEVFAGLATENIHEKMSGQAVNHTVKRQTAETIDQANTLFRQNRLKQAKVKYFEAIALSPQNSEPFYQLSKLFNIEKKTRKSLLYLNQAIDRDGSKALYYSDRGKIYYQLRDFESAINNFSKALQLTSERNHLLFNRGCCYLRLGLRDKALADFNRIDNQPEWKEKIEDQLNKFP